MFGCEWSEFFGNDIRMNLALAPADSFTRLDCGEDNLDVFELFPLAGLQ